MKENPITIWLRDNGRTSAWLADQVGCTRAHLLRVANANAPGSILAASLERVTDGGIPAKVWGME